MKETFYVECPENQIILMTEAQYGMMERNRCVEPSADIGLYQNYYNFIFGSCTTWTEELWNCAPHVGPDEV